MKRWPVVILVILLVLGAVVPGCRHVPQYDSRLTAADSLMRTNPDSALALLESLNSSPARGEVPARAEEGECPAGGEVARSDGGGGVAPAWGEVPARAEEGECPAWGAGARSDGGGGTALSTPADRAYYGLLLTQARYKAYVTATSDSDINRALDYYKKHTDECEKLTRAYIYKGAVMVELGQPDSAMLYYKHAEATAAPDDYFNLGYSNLRIAQLYQRYYANDSAVVARMKIAASFFCAANDTSYLITAIGTQGAYPKIIGEDSARLYLERAFLLSKKINSYKGLQYQSKLAGRYFFNGDYQKAKELAMEIVRNGKDNCDELQFYYYAARSFIRLNLLDSARWVMSLIPAPDDAVDSMNLYLLLADLSKATHQYEDYVRFSDSAKEIDNRIMDASRNSKLVETELEWNAGQQEKKMATDFNTLMTRTISVFLLVLALIIALSITAIKKKARRYQRELEQAQNDIEKLMDAAERKIAELETAQDEEREELKKRLTMKSTELDEITKKHRELATKHTDISRQVSSIVRHRNEALRELYQGFRVKSETRKVRSVIPLVGLIKDLNEKKRILHTEPNESFWNNLKLSVDGEYQGIASFVEKKYPDLTVKELHLFLLMCAKLPNQIIKICMGYYSDATVSNNKRRLLKEKFGMDVKLEEFLNLYLQGKLD